MNLSDILPNIKTPKIFIKIPYGNNRLSPDSMAPEIRSRNP